MTSRSKLPERYGIQAIPHCKFEDMFACRIYVPFEGVFWLVDGKNTVDVFHTRDEAMAAGARALLPILNRRIVVPGRSWPKAVDVAKGIAEHGAEGLEFGFFGGYREEPVREVVRAPTTAKPGKPGIARNRRTVIIFPVRKSVRSVVR